MLLLFLVDIYRIETFNFTTKEKYASDKIKL